MSKKTKVVITIIALCFGLILVGTKAYATTGKAINDTTRIRKKANTNSEVVAVMTKGEKIEVLSEEEGWYKVNYKEGNSTVTGYIREDLLDVENKENKTDDKIEDKKENNEEKKEQETENQNDEQEKEEIVEQEEIEENQSEQEENNIKENDKIKLNNDADIQLLPIIYSCKTGKISANTEVTVLEVVGNWTKIEAEDQEGWISLTKLENNNKIEQENENKTEENKQEEKIDEPETETKKMYVNTVTLNLREKADTNSKVVTQLNQNDEVTVIKTVDNTWSQVKANGYEGYTATEYLTTKKVKDKTSRGSDEIKKAEDAEKKKAEEAKKKAEEEAKKKAEEEAKKKAEEEAKKKAEEEAKKKAEEEAKKKEEAAQKKAAEEAKKKAETSSSKKTETKSKKSGTTGEDIIAYAKKYLGHRYVYGTAGPNTFDCSGFTSYVYKHFGYSLNRTSGGQRSNGKKVEKSDLKAGDILCFSGHVGLYIGGNKFIHAANPRKGVIISSLSESYYVKTYITARRIL